MNAPNHTNSPASAGYAASSAADKAAKEGSRLVRVASVQVKLAKDESGAVEACKHGISQARAVGCDIVVLPGHAKAFGAQTIEGPFLGGLAKLAKTLEIAVVVACTMADGVATVMLGKKGETVAITPAKDSATLDLHKFGGQVALKSGKAAVKDGAAGVELVLQSINEPGATSITSDTGAVLSSADSKAAYDLVYEDMEPAKKHYAKKQAFVVTSAPAK